MFLMVLILICCAVFALWWYMRPRRPSPPVYPGALPIIGHGYLMLGGALHFWEFEKKLNNFCLNNGGVIEARFGTHHVYVAPTWIVSHQVAIGNKIPVATGWRLGSYYPHFKSLYTAAWIANPPYRCLSYDHVIADPDDSLTVANKCLEKPYIYNFAKEMYNRGLVTANVSVWKRHRRLLNPAFNQNVLHTFVEEYVTQAKRLVSQLASEVGKEPFDVQPYMINSSLRTACRTSLGLKTDEDSVTVKKYAHATEELFVLIMDRIQRIWLHFPYIFNWSSYKKKQDSLMKIMKDITKAEIINRKSNLRSFDSLDKTKEPASAKFKPLLDQMLDLADQQDAFTEEEIREHLDTIIAAAYDTTAITLTFILILIGSHQDVQERIYNELQEVLGKQERDLNRHDLPKLVYMEAVIKEVLRLYTPAPRIARISSTDVQLKNYILPANCTYFISVYGLNRHSSWGADAELFKPERWLDPATLPEKPSAFASFSLGRRNCIGKLYGMMAIKTTLAYILRRYRIKSDIDKLVIQCHLLLKPVAGHQISLELRT